MDNGVNVKNSLHNGVILDRGAIILVLGAPLGKGARTSLNPSL